MLSLSVYITSGNRKTGRNVSLQPRPGQVNCASGNFFTIIYDAFLWSLRLAGAIVGGVRRSLARDQGYIPWCITLESWSRTRPLLLQQIPKVNLNPWHRGKFRTSQPHFARRVHPPPIDSKPVSTHFDHRSHQFKCDRINKPLTHVQLLPFKWATLYWVRPETASHVGAF